MMRHVHCLLLFIMQLGAASSQPVIHFDELKGTVNPYSATLPPCLLSVFSPATSSARDVLFKPSTETFDYYDMNQALWFPLYFFDYDYNNDGQINILNEYNFDQVINDYISSRRTTYGYDVFGFQQFYQEEIYDATTGGLINSMLNEQQHLSSGSILQEKISYWNTIAVAWTANHKHDYVYLPDGKELSITHADWVDSTMSWNAYAQYVSGYDSNNNLVRYAGNTWNSDSMWWQPETKDTMVYNAQQQLVHSESMIWSAAEEKWLIYYGNNFEYDASGNLLQITNLTWDGNTFQNLNQYFYIYENDKITNLIFQVWNASSASWENFNMIAWYYGLTGFPEQKILSNWLGTGWEATYRYLYTVDDYGNLLQSIGQTWNDQFHIWNNVERYTATWLEVMTPADVLHDQLFSPFLFPVPTAGNLYLSGLDALHHYTVTITDAAGTIWMETAVDARQPINTATLKNGMYLLTIKENSRNHVAALPFLMAK